VSHKPGSDWQSIWPIAEDQPATVKNFVTIIHKDRLRLCKTISLQNEVQFAVRIRHSYSSSCNMKKMEVYLHKPGQFHSPDFTILMPKKMLNNDENFILQLNIEIMNSLTSADFSCSQENATQTLDDCILNEAFKAAINSAGCIPISFMYVSLNCSILCGEKALVVKCLYTS
jgi:hypothetical protein